MRKLFITIMILSIIAIFYFQLSDVTKAYNDTIHGIRYKLGNSTLVEDVEIKIDGKFIKRKLSNISFIGKIVLDEKVLHCTEFDDNNMALLSYDNNGYVKTYGQIYIDDDLEMFTIAEEGWNSKDGTMISAPAINRQEAVDIHNITMNEFMKDFNIEKLD